MRGFQTCSTSEREFWRTLWLIASTALVVPVFVVVIGGGNYIGPAVVAFTLLAGLAGLSATRFFRSLACVLRRMPPEIQLQRGQKVAIQCYANDISSAQVRTVGRSFVVVTLHSGQQFKLCRPDCSIFADFEAERLHGLILRLNQRSQRATS